MLYLRIKGIHSVHEDQSEFKQDNQTFHSDSWWQEYMFYPAPKITVALLRGSLADEAGNISFERVAWLWS